MARRRSRDAAPVGAARWIAAVAIVALIGGVAAVHAVQGGRPAGDPLSAIAGASNGGLYQASSGLAIRLTGAQREALVARIARHPLDADAFALLALDWSARGDRTRAKRLVAHAIAIEPRTRMAWLWRLDTQARGGRSVEAAASALRLLAFDPDRFQVYVPVLAALTGDRRNIPQIAAALQGNPGWRAPYLFLLQQQGVDPSIRFALMQPGGTQIAAIDGERTAFIQNMIAKGDFERAYLGWLAFLPEDALNTIDTPYDSSFAGLPGPPPFNWTLSAGDGERAEAHGGLNLSYSGRRPATLATQTVLLEPGAYRVRSTVAPPDGAAPQNGSTQLGWAVTCLPSGRALGTLTLDLNATQAQVSPTFAVPAECNATMLSLTGTASEFPIAVNTRITTVRIDRVGDVAPAPAPVASPSAIPSPLANSSTPAVPQ